MIQQIDTAVFNWFQSIHNDWLTYFFRDVTSFGGPTGTALVFLFSLGLLLLIKRYELVLVNAATLFGTSVIVTCLKLWIDKPRPLPFDPDLHEACFTIIPMPHFPSFPSGHTTTSIVLYLMLAITVARMLPIWKNYVLVWGFGLPLLIGISRLYLGAHWLSDVVGGYLIGLIIVWIWTKLCPRQVCYVE